MMKFILGIGFFILAGCQTGIFIKDSPAALTEIRKAVVMVMGQPRVTSRNGREMISEYHDSKGRVDPSLARGRSRHYTHVTILGERRPYNIKVEVFLEVRVPNQTYEIIGEDNALAQRLADQIEAKLNESLRNSNVIDDFRAF